MVQKFCILAWRLDAKILHSHFPAKFITKSTTKMDHAEILHFNLEI